jgi:hypothetical protein
MKTKLIGLNRLKVVDTPEGAPAGEGGEPEMGLESTEQGTLLRLEVFQDQRVKLVVEVRLQVVRLVPAEFEF